MPFVTIAATEEAQRILGVPATVELTDARLMPTEGVFVYFLDSEGLIVSPYGEPRPIVSVTASDTRGVLRRAHWGSLNGGGIGGAAGA